MSKDRSEPAPMPVTEPNRTRQPATSSRADIEAFLGQVGALDPAVKAGELPATADYKELAYFLYSSLQGAILLAKVERSPLPLKRFVKFAFSTILR